MVRKQQTLGSIQLLRGVASLLVVFLHITINYADTFNKDLLGGFFSFGGSGVDIFFVLSGFIITYTNIENIAKPSATTGFIKRRFIRIFPIYWIIITGLLIIQFALPFFYKTHFNTGIANMLRTYLLLPGHDMVNGVSWSLTNELFFYLLFVAAFFIPSKKVSFGLMLLYFLTLIILGIANINYESGNPTVALLTFPMNAEFFLGVTVALIFRKLKKQLALPFLIAGILLFGLGIACSLNHVEPFPNSLSRVLLFGVPSFFIILGSTMLEVCKEINVHGLFLKLGDASYSIYLFHLPVVAAFYKILVRLNIHNTTLIYLLIGLLLIGICVAGIAIYHKIEKPIIKYLNKKFIRTG